MANTKKQNITLISLFGVLALTGSAIVGWEKINGVLHSDLAHASELAKVDRQVQTNTFATQKNRYSILNIALDHKRELLAKINLAATQGGMTPALQASKQDIESSIRKIQVEINVILRI